MCGIAGVLGGTAAPHAALQALAEQMAQSLAHRGPDGQGVWTNRSVALGHRRLAIIDLSPNGRQPMVSASGRWVVSFNGEVYNHLQLRSDLAGHGVQFRGHSDTETLVEWVDRFGLGPALERCNGMFALAAYDCDERVLWLARDRLGEKPLYWAVDGDRLAFASELRGLRMVPGVCRAYDERSMVSLLRWSFIPHPYTAYEGVRQLAPGGLVRAELRDSSVVVQESAWWSLETEIDRARTSGVQSTPDADHQLGELLRDSVRLRLLSDVPVGAFLSGGIDSGVVAALAQQELGGEQLRTFTVSMPELAHNETAAAVRVATHLGTRHEVLDLSSTDAATLVRRMPQVWDEPFADPSMLPSALMCEAVRGHVTVCLSGDGGDEVFGGYNRHTFGAHLWERTRWIPGGVRHRLGGAAKSIPPSAVDRWAERALKVLPDRFRFPMAGDKLHKLGELLAASDTPWLALAGIWPAHCLALPAYDPESRHQDNPVESMVLADTMAVLPDQMLVKMDRASMAVGLELRVPLLDPRLLELAWSMPIDWRTSRSRGKLPLRRLAAKLLPSDRATAPKVGFDPPLAAWLRTVLRPWAEDLLTSPRCVAEGWLDGRALHTAWSRHQAGTRRVEDQLWTVLMLEAWLAAFPLG